MELIKVDDDDETKRFIKVWITIFASLVYCYYISKKIPQGKIRLICFLPINFIFTILPLYLSVTNPLIGPTGFFIGWIANFKLLLFAFDKGPLTQYSSLLRFIFIACFPIFIKQNPHNSESKIKQNGPCPQINKSSCQISPEKEPESPLINDAIIKGLVLFVLHYFWHYQHNHYSNKYIIYFLYCIDVYFGTEILLVTAAATARYVIDDLEFEPQFNRPMLSTSLQNFWGRRWNLVASNALRETIYQPVRSIYTRMFGKRWAVSFAVVTTFAVSGLMHEMIYYYFGRLWPTWDGVWSFAFHGVCVAVEIEVKKKANGRWQLHRLVSSMLTVGYMIFAGIWLVNQLLRCGWDARREFNMVFELVDKSVLGKVEGNIASIIA